MVVSIFPERKWRQERRKWVSEAALGTLVQSQLDSCDGGKRQESLKLPVRGEAAAPLGTCRKVNDGGKSSSTHRPLPARTRLRSD